MRTNIEIDEKIMEQAFSLLGLKTKREIVEQALKEFAHNRTRKDLAELRGKIKFADGYDHKAAREGRSLSDIIIAATTEAIADIIDRHRIIHVSQADMAQITRDLQNPPEPTEALKSALRSYKKSIEEGELVIRR